MKPITKLHAYAFTFSTTVVYYIWLKLSDVFVDSVIINTVLTFIISISFYRFIYNASLYCCQKIKLFRRLILGTYDFEGIWIGFYLYNNTPYVYYEICDQSVEKMTSIGMSFDLNGQYEGCWTIIEPNVDVKNSKISYHYEMDEPNENSMTLGYGIANIVWSKKGRAQQLEGFAVDGDDKTKQMYFEIRSSLDKDELLASNEICNNKFLELAKEIYEKNREHFMHTSQTSAIVEGYKS